MILELKRKGKVITAVIPIDTPPMYSGTILVHELAVRCPLFDGEALSVNYADENGRPLTKTQMLLESREYVDENGNKQFEWISTFPNAVMTAGNKKACIAILDLYMEAQEEDADKKYRVITSEDYPFQVYPSSVNLDYEPLDDNQQIHLDRLEKRTKNTPYLVADIQKAASNAIIFINNSGVPSVPIVLGDCDETPLPEVTAGTIKIGVDAWQPMYAENQQTVTGYTYIVAAGLHGQMRDGATANDLWVSFDETDGTALLGTFKRYTVDTAGDITVYVNQPVTLTVRVWNGKALADTEARTLVTQETERAENEEQKLQQQITELQNTGVDTVARADIAAEVADRQAADEALQANIDAEITRAEGKEEVLQTAITDLTDQVDGLVTVVTFGATSWDATESALYFLGAVNKTVTVPSGKRIVQVLDSNNMPRGTWQGNVIYANEAFAGVAIII